MATITTPVTSRPIQKIGLTPKIRSTVQLDMPSGTALCTGKVRTYRLTAPITTWPTARVTMRGFSLRPPMRMPFTRPMRAATPSAVKRASTMRSFDCCETPTMIIAERVRVPGVLKSMPPVITTNICPRAAIPSRAPKGAIADSAGASSVCGTQIAATISRTTSAR